MTTNVLRMTTADLTAEALASVVSKAVKTANLSQREVADRTGIPLVTLNRRLTGRSAFTVPEVASVAEVLGLSVVEIFLRVERQTALAVPA